MKKLLIFVLIFNLSETNIFSQQCGYENYYLFAVDVRADHMTAKAPDLKMYLADELGKPRLAAVRYWEDNQWKHRSDTLFFWENEKAKKEASAKPLLRQQFNKIGDHYVVAFYLDRIELKDPENHPIYYLKIEAGYNKTTGYYYPAQIFHLPIGKAINICESQLYDGNKSKQKVLTYDKQIFKPLKITINQSQFEPSVEEEPKSELKYAIRFGYQTLPSSTEGLDAYILNEAKVYNTHNGTLHQEIYIPSISSSPWKDSKDIVKFNDYYNRGITEAIDFSVQIETWRDLENKRLRQKLNYYIFNTTTKKYELDTLLSNYSDVFFYKPLKTMRRYEFATSSKSRIINTYQLENKKWILIDKNEDLFEPIPPKIKNAPVNCILMNETAHTLPLHAVIGNDATRLVLDTFWVYNVCDDTVLISKVQSASRDFFRINQTLLPKQRTPLIFNGILSSNSLDFNTNNFHCAIILEDGTVLNVGIYIPTVSNNAFVYYRTDSTINYVVAKREKERFSTAFFTYPNGNLRATGTVQDRDTTLKVGKWQYFKDGTSGVEEVIYSKDISLSAFDNVYGYQHNRFMLKVLENGVWQEPVYDDHNNQKRFFITPKTDSIVAYTDTTSYRFVLPYKKLPPTISKQFYLLKPNERSLKVGYYKMPFQAINDQYAIILDYSRIKSGQKTTYQLTDSLISELQKYFPGIFTLKISKNQTGINLQNMEYEERRKVLQKLAGDSCVAFICQLYSINHRQGLGYCNNKVYAEIDIENPEKFRQTALNLGFSNIEIDNGDKRFWLTYPDKLINEGFFEAFDRLTREELVIAAFLNSYFEPETDNKYKD